VTEGGPAAKGGIKNGDRIVEVAGKPVKNLEGYMSVMGAQKRGEDLEVTVLRDKKKVTLKVKPE
jgi:S1-C subfamily serine protease